MRLLVTIGFLKFFEHGDLPSYIDRRSNAEETDPDGEIDRWPERREKQDQKISDRGKVRARRRGPGSGPEAGRTQRKNAARNAAAARTGDDYLPIGRLGTALPCNDRFSEIFRARRSPL